ncbi:DUF1801 domain-containing protein [Flavobacterium phycosphaerae]|uniref:DUF1801 domain-containing protein n=1 Tax=Flavobacterium phycosphaerae TaxID=2697515 RepID=UPI00138B1953|nr:DUF1801 domain-containing protein [Flavobacterium phycosphaerae]
MTQAEQFINDLEHPLKPELLELRNYIKTQFPELNEIIKWNAPSYQYDGIDFLTFKLFPPKNIQLIFHRGAKSKEQPKQHFITEASALLQWPANDRAVATFASFGDIQKQQAVLKQCIQLWIEQLSLIP